MADQNNKNNQPADNQAQDLNQLLKVRREKLEELQAAGKDPFVITKYDQTHHTEDAVNLYEEYEKETLKDYSEPTLPDEPAADAPNDVVSAYRQAKKDAYNARREILDKNGLVLSGMSPDGKLVETVELTDYPFFVGVQYHPEFKSRPNKPHPLFLGFIEAAFNNRKN